MNLKRLRQENGDADQQTKIARQLVMSEVVETFKAKLQAEKERVKTEKVLKHI